MRRFLQIGLMITAGGVLVAGCYNDNSEDLYPKAPINGTNCDTANLTYAAKIQPIFNANCAAATGCHKTGSALGGYILDNYNGAKATANSGRLVGAIKWLPGFAQMPKSSPKLTDCEILMIETWVNKGAPNN